MTCNNPIQYLTKQGLTISIINNKLNAKPSKLVTPKIANYIKQYKDTIKNELLAVSSQPLANISKLTDLTLKQQLWLNRIAYILQVTPEYLVQHNLIDQYDLIELIDKEPVIVADSIKSGCHWIRFH